MLKKIINTMVCASVPYVYLYRMSILHFGQRSDYCFRLFFSVNYIYTGIYTFHMPALIELMFSYDYYATRNTGR